MGSTHTTPAEPGGAARASVRLLAIRIEGVLGSQFGKFLSKWPKEQKINVTSRPIAHLTMSTTHNVDTAPI